MVTIQEAWWHTQPGMSMASRRLYKTQMDWGNSGVICAGNKNLCIPHEEDKKWKHFIGRKKLSLLCLSFFQSMEDSFPEEKGKTVNTCCWRWHVVSTVTAVISVCWFFHQPDDLSDFHHYKHGWDRPIPSLLQHDESSGIKEVMVSTPYKIVVI